MYAEFTDKLCIIFRLNLDSHPSFTQSELTLWLLFLTDEMRDELPVAQYGQTRCGVGWAGLDTVLSTDRI